jgi:hypothetical protein
MMDTVDPDATDDAAVFFGPGKTNIFDDDIVP